MGIAIDPSKLKLKYELKVHRKTTNWPTAEDILYEISRYLEYQDKNVMPMKRVRELLPNDPDRLMHLLSTLQKKKFIRIEENESVELLKHGWQ